MLRRMFRREEEPPPAASPSGRGSVPNARHAHVRLGEFHGLARDIVDRAIAYDEQGQRGDAVSHYAKAVEVIREGLAVDTTARPTGRSEVDEATEKRRQELHRWQAEIGARVRALQQKPTAKAPARIAARPISTVAAGARLPAPADASKFEASIEGEILDKSPGVAWADVQGLAKAKQLLKEMVILPASRPDLFHGLRAPPRGLLLYGPPGNGKTLLAKAVATEASCTFFSISAASLTSKWVGEGEKLVRALFSLARKRQPAVVFIDEIDSVLSRRGEGENEASRRMKTEFLVQFDGVASTSARDNVFVIGATNRPEELDDAVRRRLARRIYVPLPDPACREGIIRRLLEGQSAKLSSRDLAWLGRQTEGYSASDITALCHEAAMAALREISPSRIADVQASAVRPTNAGDFKAALAAVKPSVSRGQLAKYEAWTREFGTST